MTSSSTLILITLLSITTIIKFEPATGSNEETEIFKTLFDPKNYNPDIQPRNVNGTPLHLKFGASLISVQEICTQNQIIEAHLWLKMVWTDERLKFNSTFNPNGQNVTVLRVSASNVWKPSIQLANSLQDGFQVGDAKVLIYANGEVYWLPTTTVKARCTLDPTYFPFDQQTCVLKFYEANTTPEELTLELYNNKNFMDLSDYNFNANWMVIEVPAYLNVYKDQPPSTSIAYYMTFRRAGSTNVYVTTLVIPMILIGLMSILTFLLPVKSKEKIILSGAGLLGSLLLLNTVGRALPATRLVRPTIFNAMIFVIIMNLLSLGCSILIISITTRDTKMPKWIHKLFLGQLGKYLMVQSSPLGHSTGKKSDLNEVAGGNKERGANHFAGQQPSYQTSPAEDSIIKTLTQKKEQNQRNDSWKNLALILDRSFLIIFVLVGIFGFFYYYSQFPFIFEHVDEEKIVALYKR